MVYGIIIICHDYGRNAFDFSNKKDPVLIVLLGGGGVWGSCRNACNTFIVFTVMVFSFTPCRVDHVCSCNQEINDDRCVHPVEQVSIKACDPTLRCLHVRAPTSVRSNVGPMQCPPRPAFH